MNDIIIRKATRSDADGIAVLHASSWRNTYRGILSDEFLDNDLAEERKQYWKNKLALLTDKEFVLCAEKEGVIIGFAALLDKPEKGYDAYIDNLHVHHELKGKGIGGMLMQAVAELLLKSGRNSVYLWVLAGNVAAEAFYKSKGAVPADVSTVIIGNKEVSQTRFVWETLDPLTR